MRTLTAPRSSRVSVAASPDIGGKKAICVFPASSGDRHSLWRFALGSTQRSTVERLLVRVVEFQSTGPDLVLGQAFDDDVDADVADALLTVDILRIAHSQFAPQ